MKKVIIDREKFTNKLSKLIKFSPKKSIIPAFQNMMFIISENKMDIVATDGNIECVMSCEVKSKDTFTICVPAGLVFKTISLFREAEVVIKQKADNKIELSSGKSKYNISLDCFPEGFPIMTPVKVSNEITLHQSLLKLGLRSVGKFVDEENVNQNMTAINIADIENKIVFTGISMSLMCRVAVRPMSINNWKTINIPTETASKVMAMLEDVGEVTITHDEKHICFFNGKDSEESFTVMSTTADIKFPNTESVFNNKPVNSLKINTIEFRDAVKRLRNYVSEGDTPKFTVRDGGNNELILTCVDVDSVKDGEEIISILSKDGTDSIERVFQNDFITQILSNVDTDEFTLLHRVEKNYPCFIIPKVNTEEENIFSFLVASLTI